MTTEIRFFEKPNCKGNARQKAILEQAGHSLVIENILLYPFSKEELREFFGKLPLKQWFNPTAPAIKSGQLDIDTLNEQQALEAMLQDRLLIHRPLMEIKNFKICGFSIEQLEEIGINCNPDKRPELINIDVVTCPCQKQ